MRIQIIRSRSRRANRRPGALTAGPLLRGAGLVVMIGLLAAATAAGWGSRERDEEPAASAVRGEVVAVETLSDGAAELTVRRDDGSEVYVEVPEQLASSIRIQEGDRIEVDEQQTARDGERLRVQTLQIERGQ